MRQATGFISDANNHFDNEFDAYKDDLRHKLQEATGNGPMARDAINAICADLTTWAGALGHMASIAPKDVAEETREISVAERPDVDRYSRVTGSDKFSYEDIPF